MPSPSSEVKQVTLYVPPSLAAKQAKSRSVVIVGDPAKTLGLDVPPTLLVRAGKVIE
jgi:hypothetical protein